VLNSRLVLWVSISDFLVIQFLNVSDLIKVFQEETGEL
jgi:hypothetical protein